MVTLKILLASVSKKFLCNIHIYLAKENVPTLEKKCLLLVLPYLGIISLQTRTKLQQAFNCVLNCCKLKNTFKYVKPVLFLSDLKNLYPKILYLE